VQSKDKKDRLGGLRVAFFVVAAAAALAGRQKTATTRERAADSVPGKRVLWRIPSTFGAMNVYH
jgi:hypothetical protein